METRILTVRGEAFPALLKILLVGFTFFETPRDVPDAVLAYIFIFSLLLSIKIRERSTSRISRALECRPPRWLVKIAMSTFGKITFFGYIGRKESRNTQKIIDFYIIRRVHIYASPSARSARFHGVFGCRNLIHHPEIRCTLVLGKMEHFRWHGLYQYGGNNNGTFNHVGPRGETRGDMTKERDEGDTFLDVSCVV